MTSLKAASGSEHPAWVILGSEPRLGFPVNLQAVAYYPSGPPLISDGKGGWSTLPNASDTLRVMGRAAGLLLLTDMKTDAWQVLALDTLDVDGPREGGMAVGFWPTVGPCSPSGG